MAVFEELVEQLGRSTRLDGVGAAVDGAVRPLLDRRPVKNALSGTWLGHRFHPLVMVLPLGALLSSALLDRIGGRESEGAADRLLQAAVVGALPTTASGLSDWLHADTRGRRVGLVHAAANVAAVGLALASLRARASGNRRRGKRLSSVGMAAVGAGGYLGGHLSYALGVGVNQTAFVTGPDEWTDVAAVADVRAEEPLRVTVGTTAILLVRDGAEVRALADRCAHLGCSLAEGTVQDGVVECPCHGSRFRVADGRAVGGPAASAQATFDSRVQDGRVQIRERHAAATG